MTTKVVDMIAVLVIVGALPLMYFAGYSHGRLSELDRHLRELHVIGRMTNDLEFRCYDSLRDCRVKVGSMDEAFGHLME